MHAASLTLSSGGRLHLVAGCVLEFPQASGRFVVELVLFVESSAAAYTKAFAKGEGYASMAYTSGNSWLWDVSCIWRCTLGDHSPVRSTIHAIGRYKLRAHCFVPPDAALQSGDGPLQVRFGLQVGPEERTLPVTLVSRMSAHVPLVL